MRSLALNSWAFPVGCTAVSMNVGFFRGPVFRRSTVWSSVPLPSAVEAVLTADPNGHKFLMILMYQKHHLDSFIPRRRSRIPFPG